MTALLILVGAVVVGPLAVFFGADSRPHDVRGRNRSNWS